MIITIMKRPQAFTLAEILITVALIALLVMAALALLNPLKQFQKSWDGKRKHELSQLQKVFEDFYNDKQCYPKPAEICYNDTGATTCNICGNQSTSPNFSPYLPSLPCDPQSPQKNYLYQVNDTACPTYYRVYTTLSNNADPAIAEAGCQNGCGPENYNYGVTSPNTGLEKYVISQYACLPGGCAYCCYGPDCQTPCSTNENDYCNGNLFIVNNLDSCTANCPCP